MINLSNVFLFRFGIIIAVVSLLLIITFFIIYKFKYLKLQHTFDEEYGKEGSLKIKE